MKNISENLRRQDVHTLITTGVALFAAVATYGQSPYMSAVENLNPAAYWPLQETTPPPGAYMETNIGSLGQIANIYYASSLSTGVDPGVMGAVNDGDTATKFGGNSSGFGIVPTTDSRVSLPAGKPFTIETWAYATGNNQYVGLVTQTGPLGPGGNNAAGYKAGWALSQNYVPSEDDGSGTVSGEVQGWSFMVFNGTSPFSGSIALAPNQFALNTWYYLVGVFDGTNAHMYVNGVLASPDLSTPMPTGTSFVPDTWDPIEVGCGRGLGANTYPGALDEVAIYTNALTFNQISNHYNAATNGSANYSPTVLGDNPYMYWRMDAPYYSAPSYGYGFPVAANYGSLASSMNNLNTGVTGSSAAIYQPGTLPGVAGPSYAGFGANSYACAFNGLNSAVDAGYVSALDPTGNSTPLTVLGWFKGNPMDNNGRYNSLVSYSDKSWHAKINNGVTKWNYGGSNAPDLNGPAINVNDANWHMFAGVYNPPATLLYIDGIATSASTNLSILGSNSMDIFLGGAPDHIQTNGYAYNTGQQYLAGSLAHVAYFTSALSASQIQGLYSAAGAPPMIQVQPTTGIATNGGGTTNVFSVVASGATNLVYQWYLTNASGLTALTDNGTSIVGSAAATLILTNLADNESGSYFVVISNSYGTVTSSMSGLQIHSEPFISSQNPPGAFQLFVNQNYTLSVTATGGAPLSYQWYTNGVADTTAGLGSTYVLTGVSLGMSGTTFQCVVSNSISTATSALAALTVNLLPASIANSAYSTGILALNPSGYWPLHEVAMPVQADIETNYGTLGALGAAYYGDWNINFSNPSNFIELERGVPGAIAGDSDPAVRFTKGPASYLVVPHVSPLTTIKPPFTLETWVYPSDNRSYSVLIGQGGGSALNGGANDGGFALQWSGTTNSFSLVIWNGVGGGSDEYKTTSVYPEGQWYHLVATYDGTNIAMWINDQTPSYQSGSPTASMSPDSWSPLSIGAGRPAGVGPVDPFGGALDEVAIYTNVLSNNRIQTHYNAGISGGAGVYKVAVLADKPLLYYRMDSPAYAQPPRSTWAVATNYGADAINGVYTPNSLPGTYTNLPILGLSSSVVAPGNGMGAYVDASITSDFNPLGYTSFSYTALFKGYPNDDRSYSSIMSANDAQWRSEINSAGKIQAHASGGSDMTSSNVYNDGNWHQLVVTAFGNPVTKEFTNMMYVDGILQATNNGTGTNNPAADPGPEVLIGNEYGFSITNSVSNPAAERSIAGSICEAAFFNGTVLTLSQVQNLFNAAGILPYFTLQPVSATVNAGVNFTNKTSVNGSGGSFTFQWYTNGIPLSGQTSSNLVLTNVTAANISTDYYAVATSPIGSTTSSIVALNVNIAPLITNQIPASTSVTIYAGTTFNMSIAAGGEVPLYYHWYSNSVAVAVSTNASYALSNLVGSSTYTSYCVVSNAIGTATSVTWTVNVIAVSAAYPQAVLALHPIGYWRLNEAEQGNGDNGVVCNDYVGGNNGIYTNTLLGQNGYNYGDAAFPNYDTETSANFGSVANPNSCAYGISNTSISAGPGTNATFTVQGWAMSTVSTVNTPAVVGKGIYYDEEYTIDAGASPRNWRFEIRSFNGTAYNANAGVGANDSAWHFLVGVCDEVNGNVTLYIDGTNAGTVAIPQGAGIQASNSGFPMSIGARSSAGTSYDEQLVGNVNDVALFNYALTSNQIAAEYVASGVAPRISQQPPVSTNVDGNGTLVVPASVVGTAPLSCQWYDENNNLVQGATNAALTVVNITTNNVYTLQVTNIYGSATSQSVSVNVEYAPSIIQDITPSPVTAVVGSSVSFVVDVDGDLPMTNGWQFNGSALFNGSRISGATNSVLTINPVQLTDAGTYQLFVTNGSGSIASAPAVLTVVPTLSFNTSGPGWSGQGTGTASLWQGGDVLRLTDDLGNESNSVFYISPLYVGAFEATFAYQVVTPDSLADGVTFCIQNDPRGAAALGEGGGALGYGPNSYPGILNSVAFEMNIYGSAAGGMGVAFGTNGSIGPNGPITPLIFSSGDVISNFVTYNGTTATVTMTDVTVGSTNYGATFSTNTIVNITNIVGANLAYVGFTGADGGSKSTQQVSDFSFISLAPGLTAQVSGGNLLLSWSPYGIGGYVLEQSPVLGKAAVWTPVAATPTLVNNQYQVSVPISGKASFYSLILQVPGNF